MVQPEPSSFIQLAATFLIVSTGHLFTNRNGITPELFEPTTSPSAPTIVHADPVVIADPTWLDHLPPAELCIVLFFCLFTMIPLAGLIFDIVVYLIGHPKSRTTPENSAKIDDTEPAQTDATRPKPNKKVNERDAKPEEVPSKPKAKDTVPQAFSEKCQELYEMTKECAAWKAGAFWLFNFLTNTLYSMKQQLAKAQDDRDGACAGRIEAEALVAKLNRNLAAAGAGRKDAEVMVTKLKRECDDARTLQQGAQARSVELKKEADSASAEAERKSVQLQQQLNAARTDLTKAGAKVTESEKELRPSRIQSDEANTKIADVEQERDAARAGQASAEAKVVRLKVLCRQQDKSIVGQKKLMEDNIGKLQKAEDNRINALKQLQEANQIENQDLQSKLAKQTELTEDARREISKLQKELKDAKAELQLKADTSERQLRDGAASAKRTQDQHEAMLKKVHEVHNKEMHATKVKLQDVTTLACSERKKHTMIIDLRNGLEAQQEVAKTASSRAKATETRLVALNEEVVSLQDGLKDAKSQISSLEEIRQRQDQQQIAMEKKHQRDERSWKEDVTSLEQKLKNMKEECEATDKMLAERREELEREVAKVEAKDLQLQNDETVRAGLARQVIDMEQELKNTRSTRDHYNRCLKSRRKVVQDLSEMLDTIEKQPITSYAGELEAFESVKEKYPDSSINGRVLDLMRTKMAQVAGNAEAKGEIAIPENLIERMRANLKEVLDLLDPEQRREQVADPSAAVAVEKEVAQLKDHVQIFHATACCIANDREFFRSELLGLQDMVVCMEEQLFDDDKDLDEVMYSLGQKYQNQTSTQLLATMKRKIEELAEENMSIIDGEKVTKKLQEKEQAKQELREQVKALEEALTELRTELAEATDGNNNQTTGERHDPSLDHIDENYFNLDIALPATHIKFNELHWNPNLSTGTAPTNEQDFSQYNIDGNNANFDTTIPATHINPNELQRDPNVFADPAPAIEQDLGHYIIDEHFLNIDTTLPAIQISSDEVHWDPDLSWDTLLNIEQDAAPTRATAFDRLPPLEINTSGRARSAPPRMRRHRVWLENGDVELSDEEPDCLPEYAKGPDGTPIKPLGSPKGTPKRSGEDGDRIRLPFSQSKHAGGDEVSGPGDAGDSQGATPGGDDGPSGDDCGRVGSDNGPASSDVAMTGEDNGPLDGDKGPSGDDNAPASSDATPIGD